MCLRVFGFACVLMLCGVASSFGQQRQTGPRTLEGLLNSDEAQKPAAAAPVTDATDAAPKRPAGTVVRPKDGVQHPDLDKAWADYDAAVAKVTESMKAVIAKQFDAATANGDLDAAEKWQNALEKFEKAGELPTEKETKAAVGAAVTDCNEAREELTKAYETAVKALTMEKKIAEAKAVRNEMLVISTEKRVVPVPPAPPEDGGKNPRVFFLSDLEEQDVSVPVPGWGLGKNGHLNVHAESGQIFVRGFKSEKGLGMHPPSDGVSSVTYKVPDRCVRFEGVAALADSAGGNTVAFEVIAGDRVLWKSRVLQGRGAFEKCAIAIKDTNTITLIVRCIGGNHGATAVWVDPRFIVK